MIEPETQPGDDGANDSASNDVEAVMLEIRVACRADVQSEADWNQGEEDTMSWRSGGLVTVFDSMMSTLAGKSFRNEVVI